MSSPSPAAIGAACNCLALRRAARGIARRYDEAFRPLDLNNGQFSMLAAIDGLQGGGIQRIGEVLGMDRTTVTAALKPLERRGLAEVAVDEDDLRGRVVRLTEEGAALLDRAIPLWQAAQHDIARQLGGAEAAQGFRRQLGKLD
jgi:DNA-binding MarR family transcriptional regulator